MTTWYLSFRSRTAPQRDVAPALRALGEVVPFATARPSDWSGNPRDFYTRSVDVSGDGATFKLGGQLGTEASMDAGDADPSTANFTRVMLVLDGEDVEAMWAAWQRFTTAFAVAGYDDVTRLGAPGAIIRHLRRAGQAVRADALAAQVTDALVARELDRLPHDTSLSLSFTQAGDFARVLAAVTTPERITHVDLSHNDLEQLPGGLERFPALQWLNLQGNRLHPSVVLPRVAQVLRD